LQLSLGEWVQQYGGSLLPVITWVTIAGIALCSLVVVAIAIERFFALRQRRIMPPRWLEQVRRHVYRGDIRAVLESCDGQPAVLARILRAGFSRHGEGMAEVEKTLESVGQLEAGNLTRNMRGLGMIASLAPMLGFLGTVTGMIKAFNAIALAGTSNPGLVASGISEALLTTAAGLVIGIPAWVLFNILRGRADRLTTAMEAVTFELFEELSVQQHRFLSSASAGSPLAEDAKPAFVEDHENAV
jgi:biopolymer transport protein ExbB